MPPPAGAAEGATQPLFRELSRTFWRGVSSTHGLGPAIESVLHEFRTHVGAQRASVWLHDRRARELSLFASSDPGYRTATRRVSITDPDVPAALGLRLERAQILDGRTGPEPVLVMPLRGWRRALGTLVVEGTPGRRVDEQQRLDLAIELGRQLSVGIENVQLLEDMLRQRRLLEDTFNSLVDPVVSPSRAACRANERRLRDAPRSSACRLLERTLEAVGRDGRVVKGPSALDRDVDANVRACTFEHADPAHLRREVTPLARGWLPSATYVPGTSPFSRGRVRQGNAAHAAGTIEAGSPALRRRNCHGSTIRCRAYRHLSCS